MVRVKRGTTRNKKRKRLFKLVKGFKWGRKNTIRAATTALLHAGKHAFNHRRKKKGDFRKLWIIRINAALRQNGMNYSKFINGLKNKNIELDRKTLSAIAKDRPEVFKEVVEAVK